VKETGAEKVLNKSAIEWMRVTKMSSRKRSLRRGGTSLKNGTSWTLPDGVEGPSFQDWWQSKGGLKGFLSLKPSTASRGEREISKFSQTGQERIEWDVDNHAEVIPRMGFTAPEPMGNYPVLIIRKFW